MKVYIVADAGIEHFSVRHVCVSEETARKRFEEVRITLLNNAIDMQKFYAKKAKSSDNLYDEIVAVLENTTFDSVESMLSEYPIWKAYELEQ